MLPELSVIILILGFLLLLFNKYLLSKFYTHLQCNYCKLQCNYFRREGKNLNTSFLFLKSLKKHLEPSWTQGCQGLSEHHRWPRDKKWLLRKLGGTKDLTSIHIALMCPRDTLPCWGLGRSNPSLDSYSPATVLFLRKKMRTDVGDELNILATSVFKKKLLIVACALAHILLNKIIERLCSWGNLSQL